MQISQDTPEPPLQILSADQSVDVSQFEACLNTVFDSEKRAYSNISIIFLSREEMRRLKKRYFNLDVYTDVMTFNLNEDEQDIEGEIYLSHEQIVENAGLFNSGIREELHRVLIHGCLHLLGYEDSSDAERLEMGKLEDKYLKLSGIIS